MTNILGCISTGDLTGAKRKLGMTLTKMYWPLGQKSKLYISNKIFIYKEFLNPLWTYGMQMWMHRSP
jgi:hypothetical protein